MKSTIINRGISVLLCLLMLISFMSVPMTANARYADDFTGTYDDLNCAEDDCDCLEPENNRFAIVSPDSKNNTYNTIVLTGTFQEVQNYFKDNNQTDGLPVIPPTKLKAEKFMRYTSHNDNDVIATVNGRSVTAYQVAVNAIMSGSSAEYMPVCIAFAKALGNEEYLDSLKSGKLTPMLYVNGPLARQLGVDNTQGMTTEECNIAIARFMELALINLAGIKRTNAFGNIQPLVFSENEEVCLNIGWQPHHIEEGYSLNDNAVTATSFSMWGNNVTPATDLPEEIMKVLAWDITEKNLGGLGGASVEDNADTKRLIFITESVATALATKYKTKESLENALIKNARRPLWMRAYAYYYANTCGALTKSFADVYDELKSAEAEDAKTTASPAWMNGITYSNIDTVATMTKGNTDIIITGDSSRNKTQVMPGGVAVTQSVELPSAWDELMTSMSYQPLSSFYLSQQNDAITPPTNAPSVLTNGTYRILDPASGATYLTRAGRVYFDTATNTLHYYAQGATAKASVVLDPETNADFIAYLTTLGANSSFRVYNGKFRDITVRLSSNASKMYTNAVSLTDESFQGLSLTIHANNTANSNAAGGVAKDGATLDMSDTVTSFTVNLDGDVVMGESTNTDFVKLSGTTVTVDPTVEAGETAIIGSTNDNGTYRTMTFVNGGDGTYKITYNTANTLSVASSAIYLKGTFNNWTATDVFKKTDNADVVTLTKELSAGTYTFKVHNIGTDVWCGNGGTINDTANRWTMDSSSDCTLIAKGGIYEFKYEISTNKLSVYFAQTDAVAEPTTKTVYVGVIEYITNFVPTLHYWNNAVGLAGDANLTATGETVQYSVGSAYWNNAKQNFKVYKTEIPVEATGMKTFRQSNNDCWAAEDVTYAENKILLLFEWGNTYHNVTATYVAETPTEPETEPPVETVFLGDVNDDGVITINDATQIQKYLVKLLDLTEEQIEVADTSKDGNISIRDATLIQMLIAKYITEF